ncbi:MAG TPA: hypothetical protein VFY59_18090, partial [Rubrobacter sp.]|nr:hypothetical protein [Rubrobacter sp.]
LAFASGLFEATGPFGSGDIIFDVADSAWPLSMIWIGFGMTAVFWLMLGLVLRNSEERIQVAPQPAVR